MASFVDTINHDFRFRNESFIANSGIVSMTCTIAANTVGTMTIILSSDLGIVKEDNIRFQCWYGSTPGTIFNPGRFYVDSWQKVNEYFRIDAINFDYVTNPYGTFTYTDQFMNQITNDVALDYGLTPVLSTVDGGTYVGLAPTTAGPNVISSDTSKLDVIYKAGDLYGFFSYVFGGNLYTVAFNQYWSDASAPLIVDASLLALERNHNTIDTVRIIDGVLWRLPSPGTFTPQTVNYVEYGETVDLENEGYNRDNLAATRRLWGYAMSACKDVRAVKVITYGRIGPEYLPGRRLRVGRQDGTADSWVIRSHTWNYSSAGFTSEFILQLPSFLNAA